MVSWIQLNSYPIWTRRGVNFDRFIKKRDSQYFFLLARYFWDTLPLMNRKSNSFVYIFVANCQFFQITTQPAWDVFEMSQLDLHWERHLKDLSETSQKRRLFCDVFKTSQIHLKKDVFLETFLRRLKYISEKMSFLRRL